MKQSLPAMPLLLPSPVLIIGSYDPSGKADIMNAAWGGIVSTIPPCISVSLRPATLSYHNIMSARAFTVNIPSDKYVAEADFAGIVSGRDNNKFTEAHLTHERSKIINAPIVVEFPYSLECNLLNKIDMGSHTMFIGEIVGIVADEEILGQNNLPVIDKVRPILWGSFGDMCYYKTGEKIGMAFSSGKKIINQSHNL